MVSPGLVRDTAPRLRCCEPPAIGVRESRRVNGDDRLTREDVLTGRRFADEIALCGAPIEDHGAGGDTAWRYVGEGDGPGGAATGSCAFGGRASLRAT